MVAAPEPTRVGARPMVGRSLELATLERAAASGGAAVAVRGIAGVGKSRLVRELAARARSAGASVLVGRCRRSDVRQPLGPVREALLGLARTGWRPPAELASFAPSLARLVPEWGSSEAADSSTMVLAEAMLRLGVARASSSPPTVLVIEDAHWADDETVAVIEYLAENIAGNIAESVAESAARLPLLVVLTVRDGEPGDATASIDRLVASRAVAAIPLRPLSTVEVGEMARATLPDADLSDDVIARLAARTDGVPFLVEELLAATGGLVGDVAGVLPDSVASGVALRMGEIPTAAAALVAHASMFGRTFEWDVIAAATGIADVDAPALFRHAVRAQLIDADGAGYRFRHEMTRDAVLAEMSGAEIRAAAGAVLDALSAVDPGLSGERLHIAADLAERAGRSESAASLAIAGARRALDEGAPRSAVTMMERARRLSGSLSNALREELDDVDLRVSALVGEPARVEALGRRLLVSASPRRSVDIRLAMARAAVSAGRWDDAAVHLDAVRPLVLEHEAELAKVDVMTAHVAIGRDHASAALVPAESALTAAERSGDAVTQCEALEVIGRVERGRNLAAAESAFTTARDIATAAGLAVWRVRALHELGTLDMFGDLRVDRLEAARAEARAVGALTTAAVVDLQLAALHGERMEPDAGVVAARRAQDASRRFGLATLAMSHTLEAMMHGKAGRRRELDAAAAAARAVGEDVANVEVGLWGSAEASYHLHRVDLTAAAAALDRSLEWMRRVPDATYPFTGLWALLHTALEAGETSDAARAEVRALRFDPSMSRAMLDAADAIAHGRAGRPHDALTSYGEADIVLRRFARGYRRSLAQFLVAPSALADGWGEPIVWLREALATFEVLGLPDLARATRAILRDAGAAAPRRGRGAAPAPPELASLGITSRELDVLRLAAARLSNREIADRLSLSPRTVEKHIERLLQKTGTTRAGLARWGS